MPPTDVMIAKFGGKKRMPKFEDEGPPTDASDRGMGPSDESDEDMPMPGDEAMPDEGGMPDSGMGLEEQSVDDMSDILGVSPEDREDFGNALHAYVHACISKAMGGGEMEEPEGMPGGGDEYGGPPSEEEG